RIDLEDPGQNAANVRIDHGHWLLVGEARDRRGSVAPDALERPQAGDVSGQRATVLGYHLTGDLVQPHGAQVVAKALPGTDGFRPRRAGQVAESRKAFEPGVPFGNDAIDLRLLEHDLGDENGVRVARAAPGQVARVLAIPRHQALLNARNT